MLSVGLTGNVAAGKSTVAVCFKRWGATLIDADEIVHALQSPGSHIVQAIADALGRAMVHADGSLDRERVRQHVTNDEDARRTLNAIVHPAVEARRVELLSAARTRGDRIVVSDIPLLFEAADPTAFDAIVLVDAPPEARRDRLVRTRDMTPEDANRLIATQDPSGPKRDRSDYVIDNVGTPEELERQAAAVWRELEARAVAKGA